MTALLRCRGAVSEIESVFEAKADAGIAWREVCWPDETVLAIVVDERGRRVQALRWGLEPASFIEPATIRQRGTLFARDLTCSSGRLVNATMLERCLIVVEAFAYPSLTPGPSTRNWIGLWDTPLAGWAAVYDVDTGCCAGMMVGANERCAPFSKDMPRLLRAEDHDSWLDDKAGLIALSPPFKTDAFYVENLGERWSTGRLETDE